MSKIYAVRKGRKTGLFYDWDSCKSAIEGFSGAEYKSFKTEIEAQAFIKGQEIGFVEKTESFISIDKPRDNEAYIYTDGSYKDDIISFGCYIETSSRSFRFYGTVNYQSSLANIAGEIFGVLIGVQLAKDLGYKNLVIYHDYEGLYNWCNNSWRAKGDLQAKYVSLLNNFKINNSLNYNFVKVAGHSVVTGNRIADSLASKARNFIERCGVDVTKILKGTITTQDVCISDM